ncbi:MAG: hypothetical protein NVSMB9_01600 [Isosphaeraceae bacterium]
MLFPSLVLGCLALAVTSAGSAAAASVRVVERAEPFPTSESRGPGGSGNARDRAGACPSRGAVLALGDASPKKVEEPAAPASFSIRLDRLPRREGLVASVEPLHGTDPLIQARTLWSGPEEVSDSADYLVELAARSTVVFLLPPGPRTIRALEATPSTGSADAWASANLRLIWESDDTGSPLVGVNLPLGLAFGRRSGQPPVESVAVGAIGGTWINRFPMPYHTSALLRIDTEAPLEGRIRVKTTRSAPADARYFRGIAFPGVPEDSKDAAVSGRGVILVTDTDGTSGRLVGDAASWAFLSSASGDVHAPATASRDSSSTSLGSGFLLAGPPRRPASMYAWLRSEPRPAPSGTAPSTARREVAVEAFFWYSASPAPGREGR